jgi:N4-gp56 family major capsid protein
MAPPVYGAVTTVDKASEYRIFFEKTLLEHQVHTLQLFKPAYKGNIAKGQGSKTIRYFRAPPASLSNVIALTEGVPPNNAPQKLVYEFVTRTLTQFGGYGQISDIVDITEFLNSGETLSKKFGEEAALNCDTLIRDVCVNGSTEEPTKFVKRYAGTATDFTTLNALTGQQGRFSSDDLIDCTTELRLNKAQEFDDGTFCAVVSPEQERDLIEEQGSAWTYASAFQKPSQIWKGELGTLFGIKVLRTTNPMRQNVEGTDVAGGAVIAALVFGKDAFAVPSVDGENPPDPEIIIIDRADSSNPFNQFRTLSWKSLFATVCLASWAGIVLQTKTAYTTV